MPKGKKVCPKCKSELGVRVKKCDCGHEFATTTAVAASKQSMSLDPLDKRISDSVGSVRDIISRVELRPAASSSTIQDEESPRRTTISQQTIRPRTFSGSDKIAAPAGDCPVKPKGYKANWPDGPASDEVVRDWAIDVYNYYEGKYSTLAVVYFSRFFWDINGKERQRIRELIMTALHPSRQSSAHPVIPEFVDDEI